MHQVAESGEAVGVAVMAAETATSIAAIFTQLLGKEASAAEGVEASVVEPTVASVVVAANSGKAPELAWMPPILFTFFGIPRDVRPAGFSGHSGGGQEE